MKMLVYLKLQLSNPLLLIPLHVDVVSTTSISCKLTLGNASVNGVKPYYSDYQTLPIGNKERYSTIKTSSLKLKMHVKNAY